MTVCPSSGRASNLLLPDTILASFCTCGLAVTRSTISTAKSLSGPVAGRVRGADKICEAASCQPSLSSQPIIEEFASELIGCNEMSKHRKPPDGEMVAQLAEVASLSRPISYPPMKSLDGSRKHLSPKHSQNVSSHTTHRTMVVASSTNAASGTPSGGGSAAPSVSSAPPSRNDGRSSSDESKEEEAEWQPPESKEVSPNSEAQDRAPSPPSKPSGSASGHSPPDTGVGKTAGLQAINVDRAIALQTLGLLSSGQGSSSGMPVVIDIPPGEPSDITVRVVDVPATESRNNGRTFLQDGFGGLEVLVQMESLGTTELAVFQLNKFAVKREFASILSQFDSKQLALRTFGTVSLLRKAAAKYSRIKRKLAEDDGAASVIELQDEVLRLKRDQQFHSSYWIEKVAEVQRERNAAVTQMRSEFVLLMEEREKDISSLRRQVQTLEMELETARVTRRALTSRS
ncbi:unnamed protein product [Phytophthora fragariaefolia]|uniref:Unnamed protein product n=1 Tax=Phytophthora fragariaefolia TaxID=1490495 RepID=A0A9W6XC70_9STRA|nr:unnamed protein product [Phytophthora fragariaefolia]